MDRTSAPRSRSTIARIFLSPAPSRLRAGWRLLLQTAAMLTLFVIIGVPVVLVLFVLHGGLSGSAYFATNTLVELPAVTISVFLARRLLDRQSIRSLGLVLNRQTVLDLLVGMLIMFVAMGTIYAAMTLLGWIRFQGYAWQLDSPVTVVTQTLLFFLTFVAVGWCEELLSRGYHLQTLASGLGLPLGVILSSLGFGLLHLGNPNASWAAPAGIFFAGLFLAFAYLLTGQLWLSIGLHIGWNFFEGVVFGFPVSGIATYNLFRVTVSGPVLWTGGPFGPEAGLIVLLGLAFGAVLVYVYARFIRSGSRAP
jgi:membrane protease YdiL (CAAX protease family)